MSLVAYDGSSSDDDESEAPASPKSNPTKSAIPNKQREPVKITIPSLDQFQDDEDLKKPEIKKPQYKSGSGLFSMLPPPKYSTESSNFKPHILTKKKEPPKKTPLPKATLKEPSHSPVSNKNIIEEDETSDNESSEPESKMDFFSLDTNHVLPEITDLPDISTSTNTLFGALPKPAQKDQPFTDEPEGPVTHLLTESYDDDEDNLDYAAACEEYAAAQQQGVGSNSAGGSSSQSSFLEDEGFKKLKGRREKEAIEFIDVNAADQMTGKEEWLLQNLTEERAQRPSKRRGDMPSHQSRRKHQITYLAFQAKERELDLKNHWASNSRTRRETQAKYGF